ncbi:MAG: hypothetical protein AAGJ35_14555, partial [Myxococcota bacterium]
MEQRNDDYFVEMIRFLLQERAADSIHTKDPQGNTALHLALCAKTCQGQPSAHQREVVANLLLDSGANVKATNNLQETPLITAVRSGGRDLEWRLWLPLEQEGIDVNAKDGAQRTAL